MKYNKNDEELFFKVLYNNKPLNLNLSDSMLNSIKPFSSFFGYLPGVQAMAVCNSVAFSNPSEESDIDLFIILKADRFFTYRLIVSVLFHLKRIRRHSKLVKSRFCLSFFISDSNLNLSDLLIDDDVYFYYWFKNLIFLDSNIDLHTNFKLANSWLEEVFNFRQILLYRKNYLSRLIESILECRVFALLESIIRFFSLRRIHSKNKKLQYPNGVIATNSVLKFHVKDIRQNVRDDFYRLRSK